MKESKMNHACRIKGVAILSIFWCLMVTKRCASFVQISSVTNLNGASFVNRQIKISSHIHQRQKQENLNQILSATSSNTESSVPAPTFDGKLVFPMRALTAGLKGHTVAAVYAILNKNHRRGSQDSWEDCEFIGITKNLDLTLQSLVKEHGSENVAHARVISFLYPEKVAMEEVGKKWVDLSKNAGGRADSCTIVLEDWGSQSDTLEENDVANMSEEEKEKLRKALDSAKYLFDDDDDDDFDDDDDLYDTIADSGSESTKNDVVSPFAKETSVESSEDSLEFNEENVDKVLEEVRPYLISDGGNVSINRIDKETKNVYLVLEGACGSCPSSTVTMQMGIERVLKENFPDLGGVYQVDPESDKGAPTELTLEAVQAEVNRLSPALTAMGGVVRIESVDPIGVVKIQFRGSNKIQKGLELALLDVPFVKHVEFVN